MANTKTGTVKFFNGVKGFGFIIDDETQKDVFVHKTGCLTDGLRERDRVSFDTMEGKKGIEACDVELIEAQ